MQNIKKTKSKTYTKHLGEILDSIHMGIVIVDEKTHEILYANANALEIIGAPKENVIGRICHKFICPSEIGECPISDLGQAVDKSERILLRADREKIPILKTVKKTIWKGRKCLIESFIDITEHKKAEEKAKKSAEEWIKTFDAISDLVFILDDNFRFIKVNKAVCKAFKKEPNELIGKRCFEIVHGTDKPWPNCPHKKTLMTGKAATEEVYDPNLGMHLLITNSPIFDEQGEFIGAVHVAKDITALKKIEEMLQRERNILELVTENISIGLVVVSKDFRVLWANKVERKIHSDVDVIGKHCYSAFGNRNSICPNCPVNEIFEKGKDEASSEQLIEDCGGKRVWVQIFASALRDENGNITSALEVVVPITERKEMEEKLKQYSEHLEELVQKRTEELLESERRYAVLVEEAAAGVVIIQDGKVTFVNKRGLETVGYSKDEIIGLPYERFVDEKYHNLARELYLRKMQGAPPTKYEIELIAKNGERIPVEISGSLINYQGKPAILLILQDIRMRKQLEEQRLRLEKLATIGELATMIGHDLRNPLQSIENAVYYLKRNVDSDRNGKIAKMFEIIYRELGYTNKIVNDLLDFSKVRKPEFRKVSLDSLIKESLNEVKIPENVRVRVEIDQINQIEADSEDLKRLFVNTIQNAIQAMPNGGKLTISARKVDGDVELKFSDTGVGISKENMKKLFTPLFTTRAKGIGLGLCICKNIVDSHNGKIEVESEVGKGTTFTIKLPIQQQITKEEVKLFEEGIYLSRR